VTVDLGKRMNKILDIHPEDYICLVEPGVSFYALYEALKKRDWRSICGLIHQTLAAGL
jgi:FAD/FMN-containing dehydrogenase